MRDDAAWGNFYTRGDLCSETRLNQLGCRIPAHEPYTFSSGLTSIIKWDIELLFKFPDFMQLEVLKPLIWAIGYRQPDYLVGVPTGGLQLARFIGHALDIRPYRVRDANGKRPYDLSNIIDLKEQEINSILIDDVLTTGATIKKILDNSNTITTVVVLVNRSGGLTKVRGVPIISGIFADPVDGAKEKALNE